jgi:MFS superfamily sulfate permease-like transporter
VLSLQSFRTNYDGIKTVLISLGPFRSAPGGHSSNPHSGILPGSTFDELPRPQREYTRNTVLYVHPSAKYFSTQNRLISVAGFLDSIVAAKQNGARFGYSISPNRELVALGAANLVASLVPGTLPAYGSITRYAHSLVRREVFTHHCIFFCPV